MKFRLVIKDSTKELLNVVGKATVPYSRFTAQDMLDVPLLEQQLERLLGLRFHILAEEEV